jgi:hypothetical protein
VDGPSKSPGEAWEGAGDGELEATKGVMEERGVAVSQNLEADFVMS